MELAYYASDFLVPEPEKFILGFQHVKKKLECNNGGLE